MAQMTTLCPACGSGKVSPLQDNSGKSDPRNVYQCLDCAWTGQEEQLVKTAIPSDPHSLEIKQDEALSIARGMSEQYMKLIYAGASKILGQCILQAGLCGRRDSVNLSRMLRAACLGAHKATLDEAEKIANESKKLLS